MPSKYVAGAPRPTGGIGWAGLATVTPDARIFEVAIDDIFVPSDMRAVDEETVSRIAESVREIGLQPRGS